MLATPAPLAAPDPSSSASKERHESAQGQHGVGVERSRLETGYPHAKQRVWGAYTTPRGGYGQGLGTHLAVQVAHHRLVATVVKKEASILRGTSSKLSTDPATNEWSHERMADVATTPECYSSLAQTSCTPTPAPTAECTPHAIGCTWHVIACDRVHVACTLHLRRLPSRELRRT
jgi:hypothetical protein